MKLLKLVRFMVFGTVLSIIYIHVQMQVVDLAYLGKSKEKLIRQLNEDTGNATYNILKLKSSTNLGNRLLEENSDMQFLDNSDIVTLETPEKLVTEGNVVLLSKPVGKMNPILNFFSLKSEAGARLQE